jgi:hypothetical protein
MKRTLFIAFLGLTLFSCRKSNDGPLAGFPDLAGTWKMVLVKENNTGLSISKPSTVTGDVQITIMHTTGNNGEYNGHTPTNTIMDNAFSVGDNRTISFPSLGMTQVMETQWGLYFVLHISSSTEYSMYDNKLAIKTANLTLIFERV